MTLAEVLALHPGEDADAATLVAAIAAAETKRRELLDVATEVSQVRTDGLLTVENKQVQQAESRGGDARSGRS